MPTEQEKKWLQGWRAAGPELERIRNEELRALTDDEGTRQATLLGVPAKLINRKKSGIIELSRLLMKLRSVSPICSSDQQ
jgi:hypothetical protein